MTSSALVRAVVKKRGAPREADGLHWPRPGPPAAFGAIPLRLPLRGPIFSDVCLLRCCRRSSIRMFSIMQSSAISMQIAPSESTDFSKEYTVEKNAQMIFCKQTMCVCLKKRPAERKRSRETETESKTESESGSESENDFCSSHYW